MINVVKAGSAMQIDKVLVTQLLSFFPLYADVVQMAALKTAVLPEPLGCPLLLLAHLRVPTLLKLTMTCRPRAQSCRV